ncbi:hypothetical protein NFI96_032859 [Prochilodus magdalenae]|nr:hypothetical protein NFI96_032859 [Prochilodus magdalenae]
MGPAHRPASNRCNLATREHQNRLNKCPCPPPMWRELEANGSSLENEASTIRIFHHDWHHEAYRLQHNPQLEHLWDIMFPSVLFSIFSLSDVAQAVLSVSPKSWLTEGDSVTLSCEVTGSSTGWTFSWYRAVPYRQGLKQIRDAHGNVMYGVELLSDSRREAGGSYTLSPAALHAEQREENQPIRHSTALHSLYGSLRRYRNELVYLCCTYPFL